MSGIWEQFVNYFRQALEAFAEGFSFLGDHRWAAAIVGVTIALRILLLPLAIKQIKSMRETQRLQPEMQRLRQKYRNDRQRQMQEMQQLYQREGVNPYASCLPMIAQAPVFMAMYYAIRELEKTVGGGDMPFLGLAQLTDKASTTVGGWALIVLMTAAQLLTTRQLNPGQTDQQRRMQMLLPLVFVIMFINFPVALVLYWTTSNLIQLVQQLIMTRDMRKPGGGWKALLGITKPEPTKGGKSQRPAEQRAEKPQVKATAAMAVADGPSAGFDALAARRSLEEKRQRRRRKKKKRKR